MIQQSPKQNGTLRTTSKPVAYRPINKSEVIGCSPNIYKRYDSILTTVFVATEIKTFLLT